MFRYLYPSPPESDAVPLSDGTAFETESINGRVVMQRGREKPVVLMNRK
jgi:hypothetical protein